MFRVTCLTVCCAIVRDFIQNIDMCNAAWACVKVLCSISGAIITYACCNESAAKHDNFWGDNKLAAHSAKSSPNLCRTKWQEEYCYCPLDDMLLHFRYPSLPPLPQHFVWSHTKNGQRALYMWKLYELLAQKHSRMTPASAHTCLP